MALCVTGAFHTITLADDGVVHSFGRGYEKQLGLETRTEDALLPNVIPNLPKIKQVSCGAFFSVCLDYEGFVWSFGQNNLGQLGVGNTELFQTIQKIQDIPMVHSIACGFDHALIITIDSDLWSCGNNFHRQLCLENNVNQFKYQQTAFSNISKISLGGNRSFFQNEKGEIYSCGLNSNGELGLGHSDDTAPVTLIPNLPSDIIQFICGFNQTLFLNSEGNVFSVGFNHLGQLGLGHKTNQNLLHQIPNIPPIQTISCSGHSSYLIDFEGNVWSFGNNGLGQLGHGDTVDRAIPTKVARLQDIQQISHGSCPSHHFLAKDSQNRIFAMGYNIHGQLGNGEARSTGIPKEMPSQYSAIWGDIRQSRAKSARK